MGIYVLASGCVAHGCRSIDKIETGVVVLHEFAADYVDLCGIPPLGGHHAHCQATESVRVPQAVDLLLIEEVGDQSVCTERPDILKRGAVHDGLEQAEMLPVPVIARPAGEDVVAAEPDLADGHRGDERDVTTLLPDLDQEANEISEEIARVLAVRAPVIVAHAVMRLLIQEEEDSHQFLREEIIQGVVPFIEKSVRPH
ncbi:hypothetical protein FRACA_340045 [Frankia canadensis]|uniref:Uncharacterized protein n=1 Tax=Frankia canadensis TaxID=1836972 RepID=A0A2I2KV52_9ACTN|nr:hypothetical protein FRACA_340045 [Frankia canadensis]SOU56825.1 hypothetical protein FRACA_340045 [Frankia canadensis]